MNRYIIVGIVLLFLFLLLQLRIGAVLEYGQNNLQIRVRVGAWQIKVYPGPERKKGRKKKVPEAKIVKYLLTIQRKTVKNCLWNNYWILPRDLSLWRWKQPDACGVN